MLTRLFRVIGNTIFIAFCLLVLLPIGMAHRTIRYVATGIF